MDQALVEEAARAEDQEQRDQAAENGHADLAEGAATFEEADVERDAEERPEHRAEAADQRVSEGMNAEHDVEVARLDVGIVMREKRASQSGERPRGSGDAELKAIDVDADRARESGIFPERSNRHAELGALDEHDADHNRREQTPHQGQKSLGLDAALEHPADAAESLRAVGPDGFAVDLEPPVKELEADAQHLRRS